MGIDCTRNWPAMAGFLSTSILTSLTAPLAASTTFSRAGPRVLQGPHQVAQKSTITGWMREASTTSAMKLASEPSLTLDWAAGAAPVSPSSMVSDSVASAKRRAAKMVARTAARNL